MSYKESYKFIEEFEVGKIYYHSSLQFSSATKFFRVLEVEEKYITIVGSSNFNALLRDNEIRLKAKFKNVEIKPYETKKVMLENSMTSSEVISSNLLDWSQPNKKFYLEHSLEVLDIDNFPFCQRVDYTFDESNFIPTAIKESDFRELRLGKILNRKN
ncbi:MAG: hypothetical protein SLAVMIC_00476 [uncultured marine phage]|uniref:Uncharacterized protein n=1 Tax=uncultured marine phage TaxID=707152 RepID=A0A8D9CE94_9VIRU|nr:MAG: hypothetical protein SLAVMIC_00476 [uncultured marine phage]